jgi:hypothetical protein
MSVFSTTKGVWPRPKNIGRRVFMSGVWGRGEDYSQPLSDGRGSDALSEPRT